MKKLVGAYRKSTSKLRKSMPKSKIINRWRFYA